MTSCAATMLFEVLVQHIAKHLLWSHNSSSYKGNLLKKTQHLITRKKKKQWKNSLASFRCSFRTSFQENTKSGSCYCKREYIWCSLDCKQHPQFRAIFLSITTPEMLIILLGILLWKKEVSFTRCFLTYILARSFNSQLQFSNACNC